MEFLLYKLVPVIFPGGKNPNPERGIFHRFDYFDIMIVMDFMTFMSVLIFLFIYLASALYPTENIKNLLRLDSKDTKSHDFLESEQFLRSTVIQLFSYFVLSIGFVAVV